MKISREQVEANRTRILDAAGRLFRERGLENVSLAEVMRAAGLTHGGFYNHFESKDALVSAALAHQPAAEWIREALGGHASAYADGYLSPQHRDERGTACPLSCLGTEIPRTSDAVRSSLTEDVRRQVERFAADCAGDTPQERRRAAIATWAAMVGAMVLARIVDDVNLSDEILAATRASLRLV
jgi:TetR/AcrR family transcriptional repressor of nem operon